MLMGYKWIGLGLGLGMGSLCGVTIRASLCDANDNMGGGGRCWVDLSSF